MSMFMSKCVTFLLLTLITICVSRPQTQNKGSVIEDYFEPYLPPAISQFEKTEDGKYHLINSTHPEVSKVKYEAEKNDGDKISILVEGEKKTENEIHISTSTPVSVQEVAHKDIEHIPSKAVLPKFSEKEVTTKKLMEPKLRVTTDDSKEKQKIENVLGSTELSLGDGTREKNIVQNIAKDTDLSLTSKPDSKDEISDLVPDAPQVKEETEGEVAIGQYPLLPPLPLLSSGLPIVIPFVGPVLGNRHLLPSYPPAVETSDRLPMPEADVLEASSETAVATDVVPADKTQDEKERFRDILRSMFAFGFPPPLSMLLPESTDIENASDEDKTKTVDVLGRKFILKTRMANFQPSENGRFIIRFMSLRPLESDVDDKKETEIEKEATVLDTELKNPDDVKLPSSGDEKDLDKATKNSPSNGDETLLRKKAQTDNNEGLPDILKTAETKMYEKAEVNSDKLVNNPKILIKSDSEKLPENAGSISSNTKESSTASSIPVEGNAIFQKEVVIETNTNGNVEVKVNTKAQHNEDSTPKETVEATTLKTTGESNVYLGMPSQNNINENGPSVSSNPSTEEDKRVVVNTLKSTSSMNQLFTTKKEYDATPADLLFEER